MQYVKTFAFFDWTTKNRSLDVFELSTLKTFSIIHSHNGVCCASWKQNSLCCKYKMRTFAETSFFICLATVMQRRSKYCSRDTGEVAALNHRLIVQFAVSSTNSAIKTVNLYTSVCLLLRKSTVKVYRDLTVRTARTTDIYEQQQWRFVGELRRSLNKKINMNIFSEERPFQRNAYSFKVLR